MNASSSLELLKLRTTLPCGSGRITVALTRGQRHRQHRARRDATAPPPSAASTTSTRCSPCPPFLDGRDGPRHRQHRWRVPAPHYRRRLPRRAPRGRVLIAKLLAVAGLGLILGTATFGLAFAVAKPMLAANGIHHLPVDVPHYGSAPLSPPRATGCSASPSALSPATPSAAIIGAVIWVQVIEVGILHNAVRRSASGCPPEQASPSPAAEATQPPAVPGLAAIILVGWAGTIAAIAGRTAINHELP